MTPSRRRRRPRTFPSEHIVKFVVLASFTPYFSLTPALALPTSKGIRRVVNVDVVVLRGLVVVPLLTSGRT